MFDVHVVSQPEFPNWASKTVAKRPRAERRQLQEDLLKQSVPKDKTVYRLDDPLLFHAIATQKIPPGPGPQDGEARNLPERSDAR